VGRSGPGRFASSVVLVDHAANQATPGEAVMGDRQRLTDTEQLEILALLEAASTESSAMGAARALAELMRQLHALGQRIAVELPDQQRNATPAGH
jgi:putative protein kinase ArgK-like GTPase of G3E family